MSESEKLPNLAVHSEEGKKYKRNEDETSDRISAALK